MTTFNESSGKEIAASWVRPIKVEFKGGHIPSFKNAKRMAGKKLITDPDVKARKLAIEESFLWQLHSAIQTYEQEMRTGLSRRALIALLLPEDDCWTCIPETQTSCCLVDPGEEGVMISITRLTS